MGRISNTKVTGVSDDFETFSEVTWGPIVIHLRPCGLNIAMQ